MEKRIWKKDWYWIFEIQYDSLQDFLNCLITLPINDVIFSHPFSIYGDEEFTGTRDFREAWELCNYGWDDDFKNFASLVNDMTLRFTVDNHKIKKYMPVGSSPSVARYLIGIPNNMHYMKRECNIPIITINMNSSYACYTSIEQIKHRGILTLALINYLEQTRQYLVKFNFYAISRKENEIIKVQINIKKEFEKLNVKRSYFPLVHPSFLRRLIFRAREIIPELTEDWNLGYGCAMSYQEANDIFDLDVDKTIYISNPSEMGIKGYDLEEDKQAFMEYIDTQCDLFEDKNRKTKKRSYMSR